jgi:hypothetical protein
MSREQISLEELFARQGRPTQLRAILEPVADDDEKVRITPFAAGECLCSRSLSINKSSISEAFTTDEQHVCCGKSRLVVEVRFHDETLNDVFRQLADAQEGVGARIARNVDVTGSPHDVRPFPPPVGAPIGRAQCDPPYCDGHVLKQRCYQHVAVPGGATQVSYVVGIGSCRSPHEGGHHPGGITLSGLPCDPSITSDCLPIITAPR